MQTAVNPQTGERVQWNGSAWVPMGGGQTAQPQVQRPPARIYGEPKPAPAPSAPSGYRFTPNGSLEPIPGGPADKSAAPVTPSQTGPQMTPAQAEKNRARAAMLDSLVEQINRVQTLYEEGPGSTKGLAGLGDYLPFDSNRQFDTAGAGLAEQGLAAFRVPGVGAQSDTELRQFVEANKPQASDRDVSIEEKLLQLRNRVDATRAGMGLPPANWLGIGQQDNSGTMPPALGDNGPGANVGPDGTNRSTALTDLGASNNGGGGAQLGSPDAQQTLVDDPTLAGIRQAYLGRLQANQQPGVIVQWLRNEVGITDPAVLRSAAAQAAFRLKNPNVPLSEYNTAALGQKYVPLSDAGQAINIIGQSAIGAGAIAAGDALTGFNMDSLIGATGGNAERARLGMAQNADNSPIASTIGTLAGGVAGAMIPEAGLARAGITGARSALAGDAIYGAVAGGGLADYAADGSQATLGDRLAGAGTGAVAGAVGGAAGQAIARGAGALARGVQNPNVRALQDSGVPLTVGQSLGQSGIVGRTVKGVEDRLAGLPGVGDSIQTRRMEGLTKFNANQFDRALKPIGGSTGGKIGNDGILEAQQQVGQAFDRALGGKAAKFDQDFGSDIASAVVDANRIKGIDAAKFVGELDQITRSQFDLNSGTLAGRDLQLLLQRLEGLKKNYKDEAASYEINAVINKVQGAAEGLFRRQAPEVMPAYNKAKAAYKRLSILEDAVLAADNNDGLFTAAQLGRSQIRNTKKFGGKRTAAAGNMPFRAEQSAGQAVLPNAVPDSGTIGRGVVTALGAGGVGAGAGVVGGDPQTGALTGLGAIGMLAALYSRGGQRALVGLTKPKSEQTRKALDIVSSRSALLGAGGSVSAVNALAPE